MISLVDLSFRATVSCKSRICYSILGDVKRHSSSVFRLHCFCYSGALAPWVRFFGKSPVSMREILTSAYSYTAVKRLSMREKLYWRQLCLFQNTGREGNGDLISDNNELIVKNNHRLRELNISPLDAFRLLALTDALPLEWREGLKTISYIEDEPF